MKEDEYIAISLSLLRILGSSFAMKSHSMNKNRPSVCYFSALKYLMIQLSLPMQFPSQGEDLVIIFSIS